MWPFAKPDLLIEYGFGYERARLSVDGLGRPMCRVYSRYYPLFPAGKTAADRQWIPLSEAAARVWRGEPA